MLQQRTQRRTAEDFLQLNDISDLFEGIEKKRVEEIKGDKRKMAQLKESLANHMAAELGFATFKALFKHIIANYAVYLHTNLFFDNGAPILKGKENDHPMSLACYQLIKGMGLRIKYPESTNPKEAAAQRHPSIRMLCAKLGG